MDVCIDCIDCIDACVDACVFTLDQSSVVKMPHFWKTGGGLEASFPSSRQFCRVYYVITM